MLLGILAFLLLFYAARSRLPHQYEGKDALAAHTQQRRFVACNPIFSGSACARCVMCGIVARIGSNGEVGIGEVR